MAVFLLILKIIGISLLVIIGLIILLLCIPAYAYIEYNEEVAVFLRVLFIKFRVYPESERGPGKFGQWFRKIWSRISDNSNEGSETTENDDKTVKNSLQALVDDRGISGTLSFLWEILKLATGRFVKILRGVVVCRFDFDLEITGEDAADTALRYGRLCGVVYPSLSIIFQNVKRYKHTINIRPVFDRELEYDRMALVSTLKLYPIIIAWHIIGALLNLLVSEIKRQVSERTVGAEKNF